MKQSKLTNQQMKLVTGGTEDESADDKNKFKDRFGNWHWNTCMPLPGNICEGCAPAPKSEL